MYTITDVEELHGWMCERFDRHGEGLWERVREEECEEDVGCGVMRTETEEGKKVERIGGKKFVACWRRKEDPEWPVMEIEGEGNKDS